jgi:S-adenosylmethionine decarboxylase
LETDSIHFIVELSGCSPELLDDGEFILDLLCNAALAANCEIVKTNYHRFDPNGVSCAVIIAESHITCHNWSLEGYMALDIFTCGDKAMPEKALEYILKELKPVNKHVLKLNRGMNLSGQYMNYIDSKTHA